MFAEPELGLAVRNLDLAVADLDLGEDRTGAGSQARNLGELDLPLVSLFHQPRMWSSGRPLGQGMLMLTGEEAS